MNRWEQLLTEIMFKTTAYNKWVTYAADRRAKWHCDLTDKEYKKMAKEIMDEVQILTKGVQDKYLTSGIYKTIQKNRLHNSGDSTVKDKPMGLVEVPTEIPVIK